ncbi:MAG TPA: hypothetical protein VM219_09675 [Phycisphaerae bacterium]|nr:hypothetical protein [Phycisphaerae bacterium]
MAVSAEVQAGIGRYLLEVSTYLGGRTPQERRELLADLEAHVHEALAARGREPMLSDLEAVLAEMDPPESYEGPQARLAEERVPVSDPRSKRGLAYWALGLFVGGIALFGILAVVSDGRDPGFTLAAVILLMVEAIAFVLGILSWKERPGKVAVLGVLALLIWIVANYFICRSIAESYKDEAKRSMEQFLNQAKTVPEPNPPANFPPSSETKPR